MGLKDSAIQAPPRPPPAEAQWIYGSELASPRSSGSPSRAGAETASPSARPPPSLAERLFRWVFRKLSFVSRSNLPQLDAVPNPLKTRRVARTYTVVSAPEPVQHPSPPTEVAIITTSGLNIYAHDLDEFLSPVYRTDPIPRANYSAHSNHSSASRVPGTSSSGQVTHYHNIDRDASMIVDHLRDAQFRQVLPGDLSPIHPHLEKQVAAYLERPPDSHAATHVRILILSGHNANESRLAVNPEVTYRWSSLRSALQKVPPRVVVVVMLACCHAGGVLQEFIAEQTSAEIVAMAASDQHETAVADTLKGDYFLDAVFEVLQRGESKVFGNWRDFLGSVVKEMKENTQDQNPVAYVKTTQTPSYIFRALAKPPRPASRGRTSPVVQSALSPH